MRRRTYLFAGLIVAVVAVIAAAWRFSLGAAQPPDGAEHAPGKILPLSQVVLFNSGVGYFQREGAVEGDTRVDLTFPVSDVNDLLKSLVLPDLGDGKASTISYDSQEPMERTLQSFALDLTYNPTLDQILDQARGEKVEVALQQSDAGQPNTLAGVIIGLETQLASGGKPDAVTPIDPQTGHKLSLHEKAESVGDDGRVLKEYPRDLPIEVSVLNLLCADGMRSVRLSQVRRVRFLNATLDSEFRRALDVLAASHNSQKRTVSLNFSGEGKRTVKVGYVVENPIWKASYRLMLDRKGKPSLQGWALVENTSDEDWKDVRVALISSRPISFQMDLYQPLFIPRPTVEPELFASLRPPIYQGALNGQFGNQTIGQIGAIGQIGQIGALGALGGMAMQPSQQALNNRLSYEELQQRRQQQRDAKDNARKIGLAAALDPSGAASAASAEDVGDYFKYTIEQKVTLPRQKSAMLPIVNQAVGGVRVSIYHEAVQAKFPLLGLRFKNTTGQDLMQGPASVYEGGTYAGDARIMDLQPDEERLLSYAIDQGVEVKPESSAAPEQLMSVKLVKGLMQVTHKQRETKTYLVKNRAPQDRDLIIEHPIRDDWKLIAPEKADESSRDLYRFNLSVAAGKTAKLEVVEERTRPTEVGLSSLDDQAVKEFLSGSVASPKVKEALNKSLEFKAQLAATGRERAHLEKQLKAITDDQVRLRANLKEAPPNSAAYKRYLDKLDSQEVEIEKLQKNIDEKLETEKTQQAAYDDYRHGLNVD